MTSGLQHFAAGVVFAAAAIELLPDVLAHNPPVAIGGFAVGLAVVFAEELLVKAHERGETALGSATTSSGS